MAQIIWSEPALNDLDAIADYIALDNPEAAGALVQRVFAHVDHLAQHSRFGKKPSEPEASRYRQIVETPCRIFYRQKGKVIYIVHVIRGDQLLGPGNLQGGI